MRSDAPRVEPAFVRDVHRDTRAEHQVERDGGEVATAAAAQAGRQGR